MSTYRRWRCNIAYAVIWAICTFRCKRTHWDTCFPMVELFLQIFNYICTKNAFEIWRMCTNGGDMAYVSVSATVVRILGVCISAHCWLSVLWRMCYIRLITDNPVPTCPMLGLGVYTVVRHMAYVIHALSYRFLTQKPSLWQMII